MFFPSNAWAAPAAAAAGSAPNMLLSLAPFVLMIAIFYFLMIKPQQKKQAEQKTMLSNLKDGDQVLTQGGIYGKITKIKDDVITIQVAEQVKMKFSRSSVTSLKNK